MEKMISNCLSIHKPFLFLFSCFFYFILPAQVFTEKKYPQGYFIYPIGAQSIALAANFGELRPDHFHMGLDCKTDHRENLNVYAAAEGYIAKVKIEPFGFGRAIYINHPNGFTTLYAHLNDFYPELEKYIKEQQYKLQSWQIFIDIPKGMFPVRQKQFIAHSGNTGGSQGPHTHFEIRDTRTDKNLNPLLFGFPIQDHVAPTINSIAIYNRDKSTYEQRPKMIPLLRKNGHFSPVVSLITTNLDHISFGIIAFDQLSNSPNHIGLFESVLYDNEKPVVGFRLDNFSYDETRYVNANIDYKTKFSGGAYIQHLSRLPGNPQGIYKDFSGDGIIDLSDHEVHHIKIMIRDANGNRSQAIFDIQRSTAANAEVNSSNNKGVVFEPNSRNIFENNTVQVVTDEHAAYDAFTMNVSNKPSTDANSASDIYSIASGLIPLQTAAKIKIKVSGKVDPVSFDKILIKRIWNNKSEVAKAKKENNNYYSASFKKFGDFQLIVDDEPPVITASFANNANLSGKSIISIGVKDNNKSVKNFKALLDGKWLRFTNDKEEAFIYKFDEMCEPGEHVLNISVQDEAGNTSTKILKFTR